MEFLRNLNFFSGYMIGFTAMWLVPRKYFNKIAIFYYDIVETDYSQMPQDLPVSYENAQPQIEQSQQQIDQNVQNQPKNTNS
ncbi:hypothetical protein ABPG72_003702 [Tetrahymena utriculariae]